MKLLNTLLVTACLLLLLTVSSCAPTVEDPLTAHVTESHISIIATAVDNVADVEGQRTAPATEVTADTVPDATVTLTQTTTAVATPIPSATHNVTVERSPTATVPVATLNPTTTAMPQLTDDASESVMDVSGYILYSKLVDDLIFMEDIQRLQATKAHDPISLVSGIYARYSREAQKVVFAADRDGNLDVYLMSLDGSEVTRVTDNAGFDGDPDWSPSGNKFVYTSETEKGDQMFVYDVALAESTQLTIFDGSVFQPSWSPDGSSIVFAARPAGEEGTDIYLLDLATNDVVQLTNITYGVAYFPRWSPDGQTVAYLSDYAIEVDLIDGYEVEGDEVHLLWPSTDESGRLTRVQDIQGVIRPPIWSPDGRSLLVTSLTEAAVYIVDVETGHIKELVDTYLDVSDWFILDN